MLRTVLATEAHEKEGGEKKKERKRGEGAALTFATLEFSP